MKAYVVEREALTHNIQAIRRFAGSVPIWAVLKGNGYGIGLIPFSRILWENGIDRFAVTELKAKHGRWARSMSTPSTLPTTRLRLRQLS